MSWFKKHIEEEQEERKIIDIRTRKAIKPRRRTSNIEEEGEFVTINFDSKLMPTVTFEEEEEIVEEENVSTINISNISE